jgi:hypothetical protein
MAGRVDDMEVGLPYRDLLSVCKRLIGGPPRNIAVGGVHEEGHAQSRLHRIDGPVVIMMPMGGEDRLDRKTGAGGHYSLGLSGGVDDDGFGAVSQDVDVVVVGTDAQFGDDQRHAGMVAYQAVMYESGLWPMSPGRDILVM